jgi:hypothetical protein
MDLSSNFKILMAERVEREVQGLAGFVTAVSAN